MTPKDMKTSVIDGSSVTLTEKGLSAGAARLIPARAVLIVVRSGVLKHTFPVAITSRPVAINQDMKAMVCGEQLDARYLARYLKFRSPTILGWVRSTTADNFSVEQLRDLEIPLPTLREQRRIADVLDRAEALRANRLKALASLELLDYALLRDILDHYANGDSPPRAAIGDVADVQGGLTVNAARRRNLLTVPYLRVANVQRGRLNLNEIKELRVTQSEIDRTRLDVGDLLVVEGHGNGSEVGRCAVWSGDVSDCVHQNHLIRIRFDKSTILPVYAALYLNSDEGRRLLARGGKTTSGLWTISLNEV